VLLNKIYEIYPLPKQSKEMEKYYNKLIKNKDKITEVKKVEEKKNEIKKKRR